MPTYVYYCENCDTYWDVEKHMTEYSRTERCIGCDHKMERKYTKPFAIVQNPAAGRRTE